MSSLKQRLGRCYQLAGRYVIGDPAAILIHGSIQGWDYPRIKHAWAEIRDDDGEILIYDAVLEKLFEPHIHLELFAPIEDARYTSEEAAKLSLKTRHWGPWDAR